MAMIKTCKMPVLQEKSASGAVATFNTALAMPLVKCNVSFSATQEGSGIPIPSNPRNIVGVSSVELFKAGANLIDELTWITGYNIDASGNITPNNAFKYNSQYEVIEGDTYHFDGLTTTQYGNRRVHGYNANGEWVSQLAYKYVYQNTPYSIEFTIPQGVKYISISVPISDTNLYLLNGISVIVNLGGTYYSGVLDILTGVLTITSVKAVLRGSMFSAWVSSIKCIRAAVSSFTDAWLAQEGGSGLLFSHGRVVSRNEVSSYNNCVIIGDTTGGNQGVMLLKLNNEITDLDTGKAYIEAQYEADTPLEVTYLLATPFDIQLTPQQIETLIGNNTIFADTGDVDLTFKDLDIAKRGSFREVFKLP